MVLKESFFRATRPQIGRRGSVEADVSGFSGVRAPLITVWSHFLGAWRTSRIGPVEPSKPEPFNSLTKSYFLSSGHLRRHCNVSVALAVGGRTIHSSFKLASNDWQARKNSRSRSRRRPAVLRSAHPAPDPQPGDRAVVVEGWPACRRNRQPELGHGGRSNG